MNPLQIGLRIWVHRALIKQLTKREIASRYKGSYLGIVWSFIIPVFMLLIYTFVFSVVFKAKWGMTSDNKLEFAVVLFCGLVAFNIFAEVITRAPTLIVGNTNYVKKVVFPLEVLPIVALCSSIINALFSFLILIVTSSLFVGGINWTIVLLPVVLLPFMLFILGLAWFLASLGVFLRDIGQVINIFVTSLLFLSPIFYPITSIPESMRFLYEINPISYVVEDLRRIIVWGHTPDWTWLFGGTIVGLIIASLGYYWFQRTKRGFADVL